MGPAPIFFYEVSIVVLIDFIAILLTPGIFLIQIVNISMYLIHFHSKNIIKMRFPKVCFLKFQTRFRHSLSHVTRWNKLHWQQQGRHNMLLKVYLNKKWLIYNYYICSSKFWSVFWCFLKIFIKNENLSSIYCCAYNSKLNFFFFLR